jgi:hypothetical protein
VKRLFLILFRRSFLALRSNIEGNARQKDHADKNWDLQVPAWLLPLPLRCCCRRRCCCCYCGASSHPQPWHLASVFGLLLALSSTHTATLGIMYQLPPHLIHPMHCFREPANTPC